MASPRIRRLRNALLALSLLGSGLWLAGSALWQLGRTAMYVHESVVVTGTVIDVRQKPFECWAETLGKGNLSWPGDVSYQPIVSFSLPGGINAIRYDLEADNVDYKTGQEVRLISPPSQPGKAHLHRWKFLWGASCLRLGIGSLLTLAGYALWCRLRGNHPAGAAATKAPVAPAKRRSAPAPQASPTPHRRKKASASTDSSPAPRRRKKTESTASAGTETRQKKPRSPRKKKEELRQAELPF